MTNLFAENRAFIKERILENSLIDDSEYLDNVLDETIKVDITNIAEYEYSGDINDTTNIMPRYLKLPWDYCWFEYLTPAHLNFGDRINIGVFAVEEETDSEIGLLLYIFSKKGKQGDVKFVGSLIVKDKSETEIKYSNAYVGDELSSFFKKYGHKGLNGLMQGQSWPVLVSIIFSNCRNITYYDAKPPEALVKKAEKNGKIPQQVYKILDINRSSNYAKTEKEYESDGSKRRLHVCRGHFREYTEEAPLFGSYVGMVWIPMHTRGSETIGKVNKGYKVNA